MSPSGVAVPLTRLSHPRHNGSYLRRRRLRTSDPDTAELYPGFGTHYVFGYVGSPSHKVSLIVDTGSSNLAFPCAGCQQCGARNGKEDLWDPTSSTTASLISCSDCLGSFRCQEADETCVMTQRYAEGSTWTAYQISDVLRLGEPEDGESMVSVKGRGEAAVTPFGCIYHQTGMFNTQVADGIMGLSADPNAVIWKMASTKDPKNRIFSLCFSTTGGRMVIGGHDSRLNDPPGSPMHYTPAQLSNGWFGVELLDIEVGSVNIVRDPSILSRDSGVIVDSGTTDTYLPRAMASDFIAAWREATGQRYMNCDGNNYCMSLTQEAFHLAPSIEFRFQSGVSVTMPPEAYLERDPKNDWKYASRIYLTEASGAVLGANFIANQNVVFDVSNARVGFANAVCDRDVENVSSVKEASRAPIPGDCEGSSSESVSDGKCDAVCPSDLESVTTVHGQKSITKSVTMYKKGTLEVCREEKLVHRMPCSKRCSPGKGGHERQSMMPKPESLQRGESKAVKLRSDEPGQNFHGDASMREEVLGSTASQSRSPFADELECKAGVWGWCDEGCHQERYMVEGCSGPRETRACRIGDHCKPKHDEIAVFFRMMVTFSWASSALAPLEGEAIERQQHDITRWAFLLRDLLSEAVASNTEGCTAGDVSIHASDDFVARFSIRLADSDVSACSGSGYTSVPFTGVVVTTLNGTGNTTLDSPDTSKADSDNFGLFAESDLLLEQLNDDLAKLRNATDVPSRGALRDDIIVSVGKFDVRDAQRRGDLIRGYGFASSTGARVNVGNMTASQENAGKDMPHLVDPAGGAANGQSLLVTAVQLAALVTLVIVVSLARRTRRSLMKWHRSSVSTPSRQRSRGRLTWLHQPVELERHRRESGRAFDMRI